VIKNFLKILTVSGALIAAQYGMGCTGVVQKAKDGTVVVGRTMEFVPDLGSEILVSPVGREFNSNLGNDLNGKSWQAKNGYVYLNGFKQEFTVEGMNSKGLAFGYLYLPDLTKYQTVNKESLDSNIPYYYLGDYILGNFETVSQVKEALKSINVVDAPLNIPGHEGIIFPLHATITDAKGDTLVIEFINGEMKLYDNDIGVLTNGPQFDWQVTNIQNYVNLSPYLPEQIIINGYTFDGTGQGSGMFGLPGDTSPPSRFIKMAILNETVLPAENADAAVVLVAHMLDTVFIPKGFVRGKHVDENEYEITQWSVIEDLKNNKLYYNSYQDPNYKVVNLNNINFNEAPSKGIPVSIGFNPEESKF
jgi:choloylglycine hydrolase